MKVRSSVKPICAKCKVIKRGGKVKIICEGPKWCSYHHIDDAAPNEVITAIKRCLDSNNKIEDLILEIRAYQRELEERRARIDASLRSYI